VVVNRLFDSADNPTACGYVLNDDKAGGYVITQSLLARGHRNIAYLAGPSSSYGSMRRMLGYTTALEEHGLEVDQQLIQHCIPTVEGGRATAKDLILDNPEVTALFCFNDLIAIGALQYCHQQGRSVPGDMAIVGYDDIPMASWVTPTLTTLKVNFEDMGRAATKLLINHINDCADDCNSLVLDPQLIIRDSAP
jgi:LacI family transcriptional regulator